MATSPVTPAPATERVGGWTFDDLADLPDDGWDRHEVVDGLLVVSPRPLLKHDLVSLRLFRQLDRQAPAEWEGMHELGLRLGTDGRVADAGLVKAVPSSRLDRVGYDPADVALAVEVVSPSSRKTDRLFKPAEYAEAGIRAYWRVEIDPEVVVYVYRLEGAAYRLVQEVRGVPEVSVPFSMVVDVPALTTRS